MTKSFLCFVSTLTLLMFSNPVWAMGIFPKPKPKPTPTPVPTYQFGVQSLHTDPWDPVSATNIVVTGAGQTLTGTADQNGILIFTVVQGDYHVTIAKPGWFQFDGDVTVNHDFNSGDPAAPNSYYLAYMQQPHFNPAAVSEAQLRNFRGDFGGIYIPELIPQCPEDPNSHVRCTGSNGRTPAGLMAGELFTAEYGGYTPAQRKIIRDAYTTGIGVNGLPRRYTHFPISVANCHGGRDYNDIFPTPTCDQINGLLQELWDSGIYPVCFILPDSTISTDLSHLDKSLCRIVVPMWEMNGPLNDDTAMINEAIDWTRRQFPDALLYIHFTPGHGAGGSPENEWWQWVAKDGRDQWHNPPLPNPHATGSLFQSDTWDSVPDTVDRLADFTARLGGGLNGWPSPVDVVLFETDIYTKFWDARSEAQGVDYNNQVLQYLNTPLCESGRCGTLAGFCSGGTIDKN